MKHAIKHLHFVGIGGAGMSAIAEVMHGLGYRVSGSDQSDTAVTRRLAQIGVRIFTGHDASNIDGAQALVTSTAVRADNPEVIAAHAARVPVVARAVLLSELMRVKQGIAIAGTHGKTTTTSLVASVLGEAGADPTFVIGGELKSSGANARLGRGDFIVVEADESDASFLHLNPVISVVTNIDADHMETYGHDIARLRGTFVDFLHRLPFYGRAIVCSDDAGIRATLPQVQRPVTRYGLDAGADLRAVDVQALPDGRMQFVARGDEAPDLAVTLNLAGAHNVRNALAAIAVARELELPDAPIARALAQFAGVGRRFERHDGLRAADGGSYTLVDDYGHHPVEIDAVLEAARGAFVGRRLLLAFQPHRYTRTRDCFDDFAAVIARFDGAWVTDVYAAGETPIAGCDGAALARAARGANFVGAVDALAAAIAAGTRDGDVVLTMGAGSIAGVARQLAGAQEGAK